MIKDGPLTEERLRGILDYNPDTGVFRWLLRPARPDMARTDKAWNTRWVGKIAGKINDQGYRIIYADLVAYRAHRLAVLYMTGEWPRIETDHINGVRDDNRSCNLREATPAQSRANTRIPAHNTSGFKGVSWEKRRRHYVAQIQIGRKNIYLGHFDTPEEAFVAYAFAARKYFGAFARIASGRHELLINEIITRLERITSSTRRSLKGITWNKSCHKWQAQIQAYGESRYLGVFDCPAAAHFAYIIASTSGGN